jgi:hypothetical protein
MGIFANCRTNKDQGNIGLSKAIYELQILGYRISIPFTENQNYDLIVDKNDILYRVQVRTTKQKSPYGIFKVGLRTLGGNQSFNTIKKRKKGDYDLLYVLTDNNISYLIPDNDFDCENNLSLNENMSKYIIKIS